MIDRRGKPTPSVSFVVAVYNLQDFIEETLDSLLAASRPGDEIIVVNDGSNDSTAERVRAHRGHKSGMIKLFSQANQGLAATRYNGLRQASCEYVWFFDGDDIMVRTAVEASRRVLATESPDVTYVDFAWWTPGEPHMLEPSPVRSMETNKLIHDRRRVLISSFDDSISCQWGRVVRRSLLLQLLPQYCPSWCYFEDMALTPYIVSHASSYYYLPVCAVHYRQRDMAMTKKRSVETCINLVESARFSAAVTTSFPDDMACQDAAYRFLARKLAEALRQFRQTDGSAALLHTKLLSPVIQDIGDALPRIIGQFMASSNRADHRVGRHLKWSNRLGKLYALLQVAQRSLSRTRRIRHP